MREEIIATDCDIWIPAARPDVLTIDNVDKIKANLILQGANIPATPAAETEAQALASIAEKVQRNTTEMLALMDEEGVTPRVAAERMATQRVRRAMSFLRH